MAKQPACRSGGCRVCLKSFKDGDYSRVCSGCKFKVCEDCATSYTKVGEDEVNAHYSCIYNGIYVYIIAYTYEIVRTGREEKMVIDFYPENLGWAREIGQREPINCKTVGSHPLRGQSRTTDTAVRLLP